MTKVTQMISIPAIIDPRPFGRKPKEVETKEAKERIFDGIETINEKMSLTQEMNFVIREIIAAS